MDNYNNPKFELDGKTAVMLEDFTLAGYTVKKGFRSDGITSPRLAWFRYHPYSEWCPAAFVHDACIPEKGYAVARNAFVECLRELDANKVDVFLLYNAVRIKDWKRRTFGN